MELIAKILLLSSLGYLIGWMFLTGLGIEFFNENSRMDRIMTYVWYTAILFLIISFIYLISG